MKARWLGVLLFPTFFGVSCIRAATETKSFEFKKPEFHAPKIPNFHFTLPNFDAYLEGLICDKPARELSEDLKRDALTVEGPTDIQDYEKESCDGKKTVIPEMPRYNFSQTLTIQPPFYLKDKVIYATVENARTCISREIENDATVKPPSVMSQDWAAKPKWINDSGQIVIGLTDLPVKAVERLNVHDGANVLNIVYYGPCPKRVAVTADTCKKGVEIGRKTVLVNVKIHSRTLEGIYVFKEKCGNRS